MVAAPQPFVGRAAGAASCETAAEVSTRQCLRNRADDGVTVSGNRRCIQKETPVLVSYITCSAYARAGHEAGSLSTPRAAGPAHARVHGAAAGACSITPASTQPTTSSLELRSSYLLRYLSTIGRVVRAGRGHRYPSAPLAGAGPHGWMLSFSTSTKKTRRRWQDEAPAETEESAFDPAEFEAAQREADEQDSVAEALRAAAAAEAAAEKAEAEGERKRKRRKKVKKAKKAKREKQKKAKKKRKKRKTKKTEKESDSAVEDSDSDSSSSLSFGSAPGQAYWDVKALKQERVATQARDVGTAREATSVRGVDINAHLR